MVDKLLLYLGQDLQINQDITVHQPSILDIALDKLGRGFYGR